MRDLAGQLLRLHTPIAGETGSIPGHGTKILQTTWRGQKNPPKTKNQNGIHSLLNVLHSDLCPGVCFPDPSVFKMWIYERKKNQTGFVAIQKNPLLSQKTNSS